MFQYVIVVVEVDGGCGLSLVGSACCRVSAGGLWTVLLASWDLRLLREGSTGRGLGWPRCWSSGSGMPACGARVRKEGEGEGRGGLEDHGEVKGLLRQPPS